MGNNNVELLSIAVVREYLSRKGLKDVLQEFDVATGMKDYCINNRKLLAEELNIMELVRKNKKNGRKLKTFIEMIVDNLKAGKKKCSDSNDVIKYRSSKQRPPLQESSSNNLMINVLHQDHTQPTPIMHAVKTKPRDGRTPHVVSHDQHDNEYEVVDDIIDEDMVLRNPTVSTHTFGKTRPINLNEAISLKEVLFGSALTSFNMEWKQQGFNFNTNLRYGLNQEKGGPCGLLASVQAYILKHLFYINKEYARDKIPEITSSQQRYSLVHALCDILHKVSPDDTYTVVSRSTKSQTFSNAKWKPDKLTEFLILHTFNHFDQLKTFLSNSIETFTKENGCIMFLYSVIQTAGIENIRNCFDNRDNTLMGRHGYCTQEMVNLLLSGQATSNVHDDVINLDTGGKTKSVLRGVKGRNEIGYLSLFEHYRSCQVGNNYKNPLYPVWVVMCESHFSVLFSLDYSYHHNMKDFHLFYYDGLARQDEDIKLTLSFDGLACTETDDIESPIELCIQTKWKNTMIDWNGTERLL